MAEHKPDSVVPRQRFRAIVIGASAGAVEALGAILPKLPAQFPIPVMVVVHIPAESRFSLVDLFQKRCQVKLLEAADKEPIQAGTVYFAPPDYHLLVEKDFHLSLSSEEQVMFSRPSIDVLFETASDAFGTGLCGVILSGANSDGAKGLQAIVQNGGVAVVQLPESARSSAMPEAALLVCPSALVLQLEQIGTFLAQCQVGEQA